MQAAVNAILIERKAPKVREGNETRAVLKAWVSKLSPIEGYGLVLEVRG